MLPAAYRVTGRHAETRDSVTLRLEPEGPALPPFAPGQFTMLCAPGVGEAAISVSGGPRPGDMSLTQTIRDVGAVTRALCRAEHGDIIGVRGPFGAGWDIAGAAGRDLVLVAGGLGLAPLRPVLLAVLADRESYGRVTLIAGARGPGEFLFRDEVGDWTRSQGLDVTLTIDQLAAGWEGVVGFVTEPLARLAMDPGKSTAFICGPEPMMRLSAGILLDRGMAAGDIWVSLERNMKCGIGLCGHCQLGPLLVCRDGPVVDFARARSLLAVREL